jgi:diphthamide biosynthesis methyltransferase
VRTVHICAGTAAGSSERQRRKRVPHRRMCSMQIVAGTMKELLEVDFGPPLHSLIISGELHPIEQQMLQHLRPHRA